MCYITKVTNLFQSTKVNQHCLLLVLRLASTETVTTDSAIFSDVLMKTMTVIAKPFDIKPFKFGIPSTLHVPVM